MIIEPQVFEDDRGFFFESFSIQKYEELLGSNTKFVQDNFSRSSGKVLRGLHRQAQRPQGKLVMVTKGEVFDVAADVDPKSPTFGKSVSILLSENNKKQFYIPPGYAHGFAVLSDEAHFQYKCTDYYFPKDEAGTRWNDPHLNIDWPVTDPIVSEKDKSLPFLSD